MPLEPGTRVIVTNGGRAGLAAVVARVQERRRGTRPDASLAPVYDYWLHGEDGGEWGWYAEGELLACAAPSSPDGAPPKTCLACGMDLTPTPEQIRALERFGNPLRRQPCLETEDGFHQVLFGGGSLGAPGKDTAGA